MTLTLSISRSSLYYKPKGLSELDLVLMKAIDEQYLKTPYYGRRRMRHALKKRGYQVSEKKVRRLMQLMGLRAIAPGPFTSTKALEHKVFPYLLRDLKITRSNQVWSSDITYIPIMGNFMYLCAIIDWYSHKVVAWSLSTTLDAEFCVSCLERAIARYGAPEIFNSDQGSQFTSEEFIKILEKNKIRISMDGRGRFLDNIFIERLWRSLKYELIYIQEVVSVSELRKGLMTWFESYNKERFHQALGYQPPDDIYELNKAA
ncbi:IS3 family transposase [Dissulfuribacter thermophilus]|uniref:IS3 family transposase n=1 Tax=Dissulfuribacter thermophilus TaxID=1156395 RepID=UPI00137AD751|nr:IS3 family transposase [Dissulfuribacter thermophilus]